MTDGFPIVLTADRVLMANYDILFDGMLSASLTTITPPQIFADLLMPWGDKGNAPLGLRRIQAALINGGFSADDIALVDERDLHKVVGKNTKIIGVSGGEPCGLGMNSTTMSEIAGGKPWPQAMFNNLMKKVNAAKKNAPDAKVIFGGPGAWQFNINELQKFGIDHIILCYAEGNVSTVFKQIINGKLFPVKIDGVGVSAEMIPRINGPTTMGIVEISRGCGLGCQFCTLGKETMQHLPVETIIADIQTNIAAGNMNAAILSEDLLRYGGDGMKVNPEKLLEMLDQVRNIAGLKLMQIDHINVVSVTKYSDEALKSIYDTITRGQQHKYPWVNLGVETVNGELLKKNGGAPKMGTIRTEDWGDVCAETIRRLSKAGFLCMASLIIGLPGETDADIQATLEWVQKLSNEKVTVFPVLYAPPGDEPAFTANDLTIPHLELLSTAYNLNFKWIPIMYTDNQTGGGTPAWKRNMLRMMSIGQVIEWKIFFEMHKISARRRQ
jgi:radical SAM superfamily enzyme YgiQ (UPF0313 family)